MKFSLTSIVKVTADYARGATSSTHISTDFRLEVSKHLDQSVYLDNRGLPTKTGSHALTQTLIQGLAGNIKFAHEKGFKNDAEHLRYVVSELERAFVNNAECSEGMM